jgi:hypothetical protein
MKKNIYSIHACWMKICKVLFEFVVFAFNWISSWGQCYETLYLWLNNGINLTVYLSLTGPSCLVYVGKTHQRREHLKDTPLGLAPSIHTNIRLGWIGSPGTNTLAYLIPFCKERKRFYNTGPGCYKTFLPSVLDAHN